MIPPNIKPCVSNWYLQVPESARAAAAAAATAAAARASGARSQSASQPTAQRCQQASNQQILSNERERERESGAHKTR